MLKLMPLDEYPDSKSYRLACDCTNPSCDTYCEIEHDKKFNFITITFIRDVFLHLEANSWFSKQLLKLKTIIKILFSKRVKLTAEFTMIEPEHIKSFIHLLNEALEFKKE